MAQVAAVLFESCLVLLHSCQVVTISQWSGYLHVVALMHGLLDVYELNTSDYPWYMLLICLHIFLWFTLPIVALIVLLILSIYHFGVEDAAMEGSKQIWCRGVMILSGILYSDRDVNYLYTLAGVQLGYPVVFKVILLITAHQYCFNASVVVGLKTFLEVIAFTTLDSYGSFTVYYIGSHCVYSIYSNPHSLKVFNTYTAVIFVITGLLWVNVVKSIQMSVFTDYLIYLSSVATPHIILSIIK